MHKIVTRKKMMTLFEGMYCEWTLARTVLTKIEILVHVFMV